MVLSHFKQVLGAGGCRTSLLFPSPQMLFCKFWQRNFYFFVYPSIIKHWLHILTKNVNTNNIGSKFYNIFFSGRTKFSIKGAFVCFACKVATEEIYNTPGIFRTILYRFSVYITTSMPSQTLSFITASKTLKMRCRWTNLSLDVYIPPWSSWIPAIMLYGGGGGWILI